MNSVSQVGRASDFMEEEGFEDVNLYLDNDEAGASAVKKFQERFEVVRDHSKSYLNHKDLNDFLLYKQGLSLELEEAMQKSFNQGKVLEKSRFLALN